MNFATIKKLFKIFILVKQCQQYLCVLIESSVTLIFIREQKNSTMILINDLNRRIYMWLRDIFYINTQECIEKYPVIVLLLNSGVNQSK